MIHHVSDNPAKDFALIEDALIVAYELHLKHVLLEHFLLTSKRAAETTEHDHLHQFLSFMRNRSETVFQSLAISIEVIVRFDIVELAIEQHSLTASRHIGVWEIHFHIALHVAIIHEILAGKLFSLSQLL